MFLALSVIVNAVLECCIGTEKKTCVPVHLLACVFTGTIFAFFIVEWDLQKIAHKIVTHVNMQSSSTDSCVHEACCCYNSYPAKHLPKSDDLPFQLACHIHA